LIVSGISDVELKLLVTNQASPAKHAISDFVNSENPDMLICGSRGMGFLNRAFLGSVSDFLAHNAKCPLMIVRTPAKIVEADRRCEE